MRRFSIIRSLFAALRFYIVDINLCVFRKETQTLTTNYKYVMKKSLLILLAIISYFGQAHAAYHLTNGPQLPWESPVLNLGSNIFELTVSDEYWITDDDGDGWGGFGSSLSLPIEKKEGTLGVGGLFIEVTDPGLYEIILEEPESKTLIVSMHRVYKVDKIVRVQCIRHHFILTNQTQKYCNACSQKCNRNLWDFFSRNKYVC